MPLYHTVKKRLLLLGEQQQQQQHKPHHQSISHNFNKLKLSTRRALLTSSTFDIYVYIYIYICGKHFVPFCLLSSLEPWFVMISFVLTCVGVWCCTRGFPSVSLRENTRDTGCMKFDTCYYYTHTHTHISYVRCKTAKNETGGSHALALYARKDCV